MIDHGPIEAPTLEDYLEQRKQRQAAEQAARRAILKLRRRLNSSASRADLARKETQ